MMIGLGKDAFALIDDYIAVLLLDNDGREDNDESNVFRI